MNCIIQSEHCVSRNAKSDTKSDTIDQRMTTEISFGSWLRQRRRILDLTQLACANLVGCSRSTLRRIEAGDLKPSKELALILLEKLGIPESERPEWIRFARGLSKLHQKSIQGFIPSRRLTNLPAALTSFIGRENEQDEVIHLIGKNRLVTLAGAGGIGKSRLAQQAGEKLLNDYPQGVWFVSFDSLSDPSFVPQTVASVFDIHEEPNRPAIETLKNILRQKTMLLILDNCEHLLTACAQLIKTLLIHCPDLKILVTSREILNIEGEATYNLQTLSLPENDEALPEKMDKYESVRLFEERAALAFSSFRLKKETAQTVGQICRRVDGIPLAIELAAARVDTLQVNEILKQLNRCFDLLANNRRIALPRHQTMRASIDWSWGLLNEDEQMFIWRLSVFAGGWTLESAQAVCEGDALNLTSALVRKSLIMVNQEAGRETRYRFHEVVRQYAREKLAQAGEEENICTRHLKYFLQFSEQAEPALKGPTQIEWFARLNDERDNLRAALEWADKTDAEAGLYLSGRLLLHWESFDFLEGNYWLSKFLQKPESHAHPRARAKALYAHGRVLDFLAQPDAARSSAQVCLVLFRAVGDRHGEVDGLLRLAWETMDPTEKSALIQQALALAQSLGDVRRQADAFGYLGWLGPADRFADRFVQWEKAITLARASGDWLSLADRLYTVGRFLILNGDVETAQKHLDESRALYQQLNPRLAEAKFLPAYGQIALLQRDFKKARACFQEEAKICAEFGNRKGYLWARVNLSYVALREGNFNEAYRNFAETAYDFQNDHNIEGVIFTLEGMAGLYMATEKPVIAARLIGWADALREQIKDGRPLLEQADVNKIIEACLMKMGEVAFSDAYDEGQAMTLDEAVAYTFKER
jgi:predicted ATPase/DNA-binding XRE family transcriptional regulator